MFRIKDTLLFLTLLLSFVSAFAQDQGIGDRTLEPPKVEEAEPVNLDEIDLEEDLNQTSQSEPTLDDENTLIEQIENLNRVNEGNFILRPFIYNQRGRRDPFTPIVGDKKVVKQVVDKNVILPELEKYRIDSFVLTSVLWSVNEPKALIKDPESKIHLIKVNSRIGTKNGYVAKIREGEIVVVEEEINEAGEALFTTQVLKIGR